VRFHPDYKLTDTVRTPVDRLERAREIALEMGMRHVYLGNVYDHEAANTYCSSCRSLQVTRYGLNASLAGLTPDGHCAACGTHANFKLFDGPAQARPTVQELPGDQALKTASFQWHGDVRALHVQLQNTTEAPQAIYLRRVGDPAVSTAWTVTTLAPGESHRFISAKSTPAEAGIELAIPEVLTSSLHEVFDRAHFPTVDLAAGSLNADISPLPAYQTLKKRV
jgi:pyruvate formate lyase activating enzyme